MAGFGKQTRLGLSNTNPIRRLAKALDLTGAAKNHPRVVKMYKEWTKIYRGFVHKRFNAAARGNGTWPPLARPRSTPRTKSGKRDKRFTRSGNLILIDTKTLLNAVDPDLYNAPGSFSRREGSGLIIGYGGEVVHPTAAANGRNITIAQIAGFHQAGGGRLPQRRIIVGPDQDTIGKVTAEVNATVRDLLKEAGLSQR